MKINSTYRLPLPQNPAFLEFVTSEGLLPHELNQIDALWDNEKADRAQVSGSDETYNEKIRQTSVIPLLPEQGYSWIFDRVSALAVQANNERYAFDILGIDEPLQLAEYSKGDFFQWHMDFGPGESSCRKLSLTVQLSDPDTYEGGDLQFMINDKTVNAPRERGTVIIFPSFVLHRVTPVTRGKRRSIVGWISGTPYR
jgi:PKHD-type hydroxylase